MHHEFTTQIITIYCLCDDFLRAWGHKDDPQAKMGTAEVMTVTLTAAALFSGNQERSRRFLSEHGYIKPMLSKSRLNRRLHAIPETLWQGLLALLGEAHKQLGEAHKQLGEAHKQLGEAHKQLGEAHKQLGEDSYLVDSMPVLVCDNIRIWRSRLYPPGAAACTHLAQPLVPTSSAWRGLPRLRCQQAALFLRPAPASGRHRQRAAC